MTANVAIVIAHRDDALQIKNAALRFRPPDATPVEPNGTSPPGRPGSGRGGAVRRVELNAQFMFSICASRPKPVQIKTGISDGISPKFLKA